MVRKMKPVEATEKLPFVQKRAADDLAKVIKSAIANAKEKVVAYSDLIFKEIQIGEGPRLKRGRPASRGMWHPFKKRMAHIRVVLTARNVQVPSPKSETNSKESNIKKETKTKETEVEKKGKEKKA
jgi:large subunit ribosomal protein L22